MTCVKLFNKFLMTDSNEEIYEIVPPDKGWSWVVCVVSFLSQFVCDGIVFTLSTFYEEIAKDFKTTKGKIYATTSYVLLFYSLAGIIGNVLLIFFQLRTVAILGGFLGSVGFICSGLLAHHYVVLYVSLGFVTGMGFGLIFLTSNVILLYYFEKRRSIATGIGASGTGIGCIVLPLVVNIVKTNYGWRKSFLFLSTLSGALCLLSILYLPLEPVLVSNENDKSKPKKACSIMIDKRLRANFKKLSCREKIAIIIDCRLLKSLAFVLFLISGMVLNGEYIGIIMYLVEHEKWIGFSSELSVYMLSFYGFFCSLGRIFFGVIQDCHFYDNIIISAIFFTVAGFLALIGSFEFTSNIYLQFVLLGLTGLFIGPHCMRSVLIVDLFGMEYLIVAFGMNILAMGIGAFILNYVFSEIYDLTHNYLWIYVVIFINAIMSSTLYLILRPIRNWEKKRGILIDEI